MLEKRTALHRVVLRMILILLGLMVPLSSAEASESKAASAQVSMSFDDYLAQGEAAWFLTGKKEYTVQAMMVSGETSFRNELEMTDYTVTDDGITVILKGNYGEMWASKLSKVISTYTKPDGSALSGADFARKNMWISIVAKPEPDAYYAMYVPLNISVTVETAWGDVLHSNLPNAPHGDGDYLVCRVGKDRKPDLSDVWILNGLVFPEYYDTSNSMRPSL